MFQKLKLSKNVNNIFQAPFGDPVERQWKANKNNLEEIQNVTEIELKKNWKGIEKEKKVQIEKGEKVQIEKENKSPNTKGI